MFFFAIISKLKIKEITTVVFDMQYVKTLTVARIRIRLQKKLGNFQTKSLLYFQTFISVIHTVHCIIKSA